MQLSGIENKEGFVKSLSVSFSAEEGKKERNSVVNDFCKKVRINGFRKGHVPRNMIEKNYAADIEQTIYDNFANKCFRDVVNAISEDAVANTLTISNATREEDGGYKLDFTFEVYPEYPEHKNTQEVEANLYKLEITDEDLDKTISSLRQNFGTWANEDDLAVGDNTKANIDFVGSRDGVKFEGGEAKGFDIIVGKTSMIPGFVEQLYGHKAGESFGIDVKFPDEYHATELAGKDAHFEITINTVAKFVESELNDIFFKRFNVSSLDELKNSLKDQLTREGKQRIFNLNQDILYAASVDACNIGDELPQKLFAKIKENTLDNRVKQFFQSQGMYNAKPEFVNQIKKIFATSIDAEVTKITKNECAVHYLLKPFAKELDNAEALKAKVAEIVESEAVAYEDPNEFKTQYASDKNLKRQIDTIASIHLEYDKLKSLFKVSEQSVGFYELQDVLAKRHEELQKQLDAEAQEQKSEQA